jgi:hypothetical protein
MSRTRTLLACFTGGHFGYRREVRIRSTAIAKMSTELPGTT